MDWAQTTAEWEPEQYSNMDINGGSTRAVWALDV